jgi:hypothetical protein
MAPTDRARLAAWQLRWNAEAIRHAATLQPAMLEDGRRLRGIALGDGVVLGKDLRWYRIDNARATRLTAAALLTILPYELLRRRFREAHEQAKRRS